ncbi:MAG TPA: hypothetical protein VNW68_02625 [Candidatus Limnocylindria bacterium]|nr:hypothetical protein [Candidatus Limnocylindria bacterium]
MHLPLPAPIAAVALGGTMLVGTLLLGQAIAGGECRRAPVAAASGFGVTAHSEVDGVRWITIEDPAAGAGERLVDVLGQLDPLVAEGIGRREVDGQTAAGCRVLVDGPAAFAAVPQFAELVDAGPFERHRRLADWRGWLDWWTTADGLMVGASVRIGGLPRDAWEKAGLRGILAAEVSTGRGER